VGVGIQGHASAAFPVVRAPVPILQEAERGLRVGLDWFGEDKIFAPSLGMKPRNLQPITSRYTESNSFLSANFEITNLKFKENALSKNKLERSISTTVCKLKISCCEAGHKHLLIGRDRHCWKRKSQKLRKEYIQGRIAAIVLIIFFLLQT
jgi:hypothetical protein